MIKLAVMTFNPYGENTYLLYGENKECIIVDAGCFSEKEEQALISFIEKNELKPVLALNTHAHIDHICGVDFVQRTWNIPFALHHADQPLLEYAPSYAQAMGFTIENAPVATVDLAETTQFRLGEETIEIIHTPGHSPGHVSVHVPSAGILLTGDLLFKESIGRTDLPGGDYPTIMRSIIEKVIPLGGAVDIYPGHGPASTIAHEAMYNPFIVEAVQGEVNY